MQGLGQILIAVNCSQNLNKENIADKIKAEIEAKSNERNLGTVEKFLRCTVPECDGMIKCKKKIPSKEELWLHGCART